MDITTDEPDDAVIPEVDPHDRLDPEVINPAGAVEQKRVRELIASGQSVFLTGKAGTGKSHVTKQVITQAKAAGRKVMVCGSTGMAAQGLGGYTVHRALGLWPDVDPDADYFEIIDVDSPTRAALRAVDLLIVDEISMIRVDLFEAMSLRFQAARCGRMDDGQPKPPFGGVTLLLVGDLLQLPPVVSFRHDMDAGRAFYRRWEDPTFQGSRIYPEMVAAGFSEQTLVHTWRQTDPEMIAMLDQIRYGDSDEAVMSVLRTHVDTDSGLTTRSTLEDRITVAVDRATQEWTVLAAHKAHVHSINDRVLTQVCREEEIRSFEVVTRGKITPSEIEGLGFRLDEVTKKPLDQRFGPDARVMFVRNDPEGRWVNGSMGTVVDFTYVEARDSSFASEQAIVVELDDGRDVTATQQEFSIDEPRVELARELDDDGRWTGEMIEVMTKASVGSVTGFPVSLAWAVTVHKSQGQSLERCYVFNPANMGNAGQLYVALSRAKSPKGLVLDSEPQPSQVRAERVRVRRDKVAALQDTAGRNTPVSRLAFVSVSGPDSNNRKRVGSVAVRVIDASSGAVVAEFGTWIAPGCLVQDWRGEWGWEMGLSLSEMPLAMAPTLEQAWPAIHRQLHGAVLVADDLGRLEGALSGENSQSGQGRYELGAGVNVAELCELHAGVGEPWARIGELTALWRSGALESALAWTEDVRDYEQKAKEQQAVLLATKQLVPRSGQVVLDVAPGRATISDAVWAALMSQVSDPADVAAAPVIWPEHVQEHVPGVLSELVRRADERTGWGADTAALWHSWAHRAGVDTDQAHALAVGGGPSGAVRGPAGPEALRSGQVVLLRGVGYYKKAVNDAGGKVPDQRWAWAEKWGVRFYGESYTPPATAKGFQPKLVDVVVTPDPSVIDYQTDDARRAGAAVMTPKAFMAWVVEQKQAQYVPPAGAPVLTAQK